jgi:methionyl aminopeptidase
MRAAGEVVAAMHAALRSSMAPGISTAELDEVARGVLASHHATSNFLGYHDYPAVICASIDDVVIHGIPSHDTIVAPGSLVSIDCGAILDGWHGDAAFSVVVPGGAPDRTAAAADLVAAAERALAAAMDACRPGHRIGAIGAAVHASVRASGHRLVDGYGGHVIGRAMHEDPSIPNLGTPGEGRLLQEGSTVCIEPMLVAGGPAGATVECDLDDDGWTLRSPRGELTAHVEHTVAVTSDGGVALTVAPSSRHDGTHLAISPGRR